MTLLWILLFFVVLGAVAYFRLPLILSTAALAVYFLLVTFFSHASPVWLTIWWVLFLAIAIPLNVLPLRRLLLTRSILSIYHKTMPSMSRTEREALEAGTVGWDAELFSGKPDWKKFLEYRVPKLSPEEQAFLDGPVEELCRMTDDWDITHNLVNLPDKIWQFIKEKGFFGIIIPKQYGGLEFSALAHSYIISKLSGRSVSVATTVGVPNSLGPAELLLHYGTEEQKNYYLPRLARGEEIPCFALTAPEAGSDAGAMPDYGIICRGNFAGKEVLGIRLNWNKRYITLAPIATVLGLAFKLYDPDHLIGEKKDLGITCALIPTNTPGIEIGRRHFPVNAAFLNGPTQGKDIFIPIDWIIGGQEMAGQGWRMLMECLSAGRAISLPSTVLGGIKIGAYATGAYSRIRRQFGLSVGKFEAVEEALTRIAGNAYIAEATRVMTVNMVDHGEKPSVLSAVSKYHTTELARKISDDAMDIHGGKGIQLGPRNYLGRPYEEMPIAITVEGANILTRGMIIFGQGAIRCHPYVYPALQAAKDPDTKRGLINFDKAIFGHFGFIISNKVRAFVLALTQGKLARSPLPHNQRYYQQIKRFSAAFALTADISMFVLGGSLKRREKLSARLGDILSMMYMTSAVLKRFEDQGRPEEDQVLVDWSCQTLLFQAQQQLAGILRNFPNRIVAFWLHCIIFPLGKWLQPPSDKLGHQVASLLISPTAARARLAEGAYLTPEKGNQVGLMEEALLKIIPSEELQRKLHKARQDGIVKGITFEDRVKMGVANNVLTQAEADQLLEAVRLRKEVCAVDDFTNDELARVPRRSD